jgi:hypothetical protein
MSMASSSRETGAPATTPWWILTSTPGTAPGGAVGEAKPA